MTPERLNPKGPPGQRPPKPEPSFGKRRKPLKKKQQSRPPKMSADAKVQDAMLGKGRCWLTDYEGHDCTDGYTQRSHIVKQTIIEDAYPMGAARFLSVWIAFDELMPLDAASEFRTLQEILDDNRNIVPTCPNGNRDGADMVDALDCVGYPEGFDDFCAEYGWYFNGRYWVREAGQRRAA